MGARMRVTGEGVEVAVGRVERRAGAERVGMPVVWARRAVQDDPRIQVLALPETVRRTPWSGAATAGTAEPTGSRAVRTTVVRAARRRMSGSGAPGSVARDCGATPPRHRRRDKQPRRAPLARTPPPRVPSRTGNVTPGAHRGPRAPSDYPSLHVAEGGVPGRRVCELPPPGHERFRTARSRVRPCPTPAPAPTPTRREVTTPSPYASNTITTAHAPKALRAAAPTRMRTPAGGVGSRTRGPATHPRSGPVRRMTALTHP